jgi:ERCC4-type nuclease
MIYIDPSELRQNSKLLKCLDNNPDFGLDETKWQPLNGLEQLTGADVMISPEGLPYPSTEFLIKFHIKKGAFLVQLKFDHDLIASILDGRYKEAQSRMKLIGSAPWQRILLQVGFFYRDEENNICANGQKSIDVIGASARSFRFKYLLSIKTLWGARGGQFQEVATCDLIKWFEAQEHCLKSLAESPQKFVWPSSPELYENELEIMDNPNWIQKEWRSAQELILIDDWRKMLMSLPGIGNKKARQIGQEYESWLEFEKAIITNSLEIKGIGKKTIDGIREFIGG